MNQTQILDFVLSCQNVILSSVDDLGFPRSRALLAPRRNEGLNYFWHSTNTSFAESCSICKK